MNIVYSDEDIEKLIKERKPLPEDFTTDIHLKDKSGHKEYDLDVKGDNGSNFD
jgi:hypothetical protein